MDCRIFGQNPSSSTAETSEDSTQDLEVEVYDNDDEIDFSRSTQESGMVSIDEQPLSKMFTIRLKGSSRPPCTIKIFKEKVSAMYDKISKKVLMEPGTFRLDYELNLKSGKKRQQSLEFNTDQELLEEACEILYCQAKNNDTLIVVKDDSFKKKKKSSRPKVPSERIFPDFVKGLGTANKKTYAVMAENTQILTGYMNKLSLTRVLLGDESCSNLLNPAEFVCPIESCKGKKPKQLHSWNSLFNFHKHLTTHNLEKDMVAKAINERYKVLDINGWHDSNIHLGIPEMITVLNDKNGCSIQNMKLHKVKEGGKFRGSDSCLKEAILREFMAGDFSALKRIKNQPTISSLAGMASSGETVTDEEMQEDEDGAGEDAGETVTNEERPVVGDQPEDVASEVGEVEQGQKREGLYVSDED